MSIPPRMKLNNVKTIPLPWSTGTPRPTSLARFKGHYRPLMVEAGLNRWTLLTLAVMSFA